VSEHQFYEFVAIDRPLTCKEMAELRSLIDGMPGLARPPLRRAFATSTRNMRIIDLVDAFAPAAMSRSRL
jgi:hypothetical protein